MGATDESLTWPVMVAVTCWPRPEVGMNRQVASRQVDNLSRIDCCILFISFLFASTPNSEVHDNPPAGTVRTTCDHRVRHPARNPDKCPVHNGCHPVMRRFVTAPNILGYNHLTTI